MLTTVRIGPNNVRLGIDAPREMQIVREELIDGKPQPQKTETAPQVA